MSPNLKKKKKKSPYSFKQVPFLVPDLSLLPFTSKCLESWAIFVASTSYFISYSGSIYCHPDPSPLPATHKQNRLAGDSSRPSPRCSSLFCSPYFAWAALHLPTTTEIFLKCKLDHDTYRLEILSGVAGTQRCMRSSSPGIAGPRPVPPRARCPAHPATPCRPLSGGNSVGGLGVLYPFRALPRLLILHVVPLLSLFTGAFKPLEPSPCLQSFSTALTAHVTRDLNMHQLERASPCTRVSRHTRTHTPVGWGLLESRGSIHLSVVCLQG